MLEGLKLSVMDRISVSITAAFSVALLQLGATAQIYLPGPGESALGVVRIRRPQVSSSSAALSTACQMLCDCLAASDGSNFRVGGKAEGESTLSSVLKPK